MISTILINIIPEKCKKLNLDGKSKIAGKVKYIRQSLFLSIANQYMFTCTSLYTESCNIFLFSNMANVSSLQNILFFLGSVNKSKNKENVYTNSIRCYRAG